MIGIAGVLLVIIIVFSVAVVVSNPAVFDLSIFGATIPVTAAGIYFTGAGAMLVLILAAALMRRGITRDRAHRRQLRSRSTPTSVQNPPPSATGARSGSAADLDARVGLSESPESARSDPGRPDPGRSNPVRSSPVPSDATTDGGKRSQAVSGQTVDAAERQALLDEAEELTGDGDDR